MLGYWVYCSEQWTEDLQEYLALSSLLSLNYLPANASPCPCAQALPPQALCAALPPKVWIIQGSGFYIWKNITHRLQLIPRHPGLIGVEIIRARVTTGCAIREIWIWELVSSSWMAITTTTITLNALIYSELIRSLGILRYMYGV